MNIKVMDSIELQTRVQSITRGGETLFIPAATPTVIGSEVTQGKLRINVKTRNLPREILTGNAMGVGQDRFNVWRIQSLSDSADMYVKDPDREGFQYIPKGSNSPMISRGGLGNHKEVYIFPKSSKATHVLKVTYSDALHGKNAQFNEIAIPDEDEMDGESGRSRLLRTIHNQQNFDWN